MLTEEEFIELRNQVLAGREALAQILQACQEAVRATARAQIRNQGNLAGAESSDAFQSVVLKFFDNPALDHLFRATSFENFQHRVQAMVRNKVIDYVRYEILRITRPIHTAADPQSREQTPSAQLQRWESAEAIEQVLSELNDEDRRLLDLMVAKKADKEIAAEIGWTEPQAKKRRQRFIQRLRNRFAQGV